MNKMLSFFRKYATLKNALIAFVVLQIVIQILHKFDEPLNALTPGVGKLDFHPHYDVSTVIRIFEAYGEHGRTIYTWDLLADTAFPLALTTAAILFIMTITRRPFLQYLLVAFPLMFVVMDVFENAFFLLFLVTYPSLSPIVVNCASLITRIKLFAIYPTWIELYLLLPIAVISTIVGFVKSQQNIRRAASVRIPSETHQN